MAKVRTVYLCRECGAEHAKWVGRCRDCGEWNTLEETVQEPRASGSFGFGRQARAGTLVASNNLPLKIGDIEANAYERIPLPMEEFTRVLGGGVVPGSLVLVGGDPGIGKSTLLSQVSGMLAEALGPVLYLSGEESVYQVKMRAERLGMADKDLYLLSETNLDIAIEHINTLRPKAVIIDSIQTVYLQDLSSSAGSISQVRECAARLMQLAKGENLPIFLVGHVTKEGAIAGPRVLEHIVDTVLYLEGDRFNTFRLLRAQKNRFGSTNEVGVFEMVEGGMVEVPNPSEAFLADYQAGATGSAVAVTMEGTRPILVEMQSLVTQSAFSQPRRTANGVDMNRLHLLLAVLGKRVGLQLFNQDVFVNVVGGLRISEPAADLAIAAAITSSYREKSIPRDLALVGEIGLGGELRPVSQLDKRLNEAAKLGFTRCVVPKSGRRPLQAEGIEVIAVRSLVEALHLTLKES
ncbi:MAG: DNA repair protein RadA [Ardenticatenales bacterium]|nr:DNA repair protein RadA [Ardenticatenales bacterium]